MKQAGAKAKIKRTLASRRRSLAELDMEVANDKEKALSVRARGANLRARLGAIASGKATAKSRRCDLVDRDIFLVIRELLGRRARVELCARGGPGVIKIEGPLHQGRWRQFRKEQSAALKALGPSDTLTRKVWVPHWDHTGDMMKLVACGASIAGENARAFSLHLADDVVEAARSNPKGFGPHIRDRLQRQLRRRFAAARMTTPGFFFVLEATDLTRVHVHGGLLLPPILGAHELARKALKSGGGKWRLKDTGRQLDLVPLDTPVRWVNYISKWKLGSELKLQGSSWAATSGVRANARSWYQAARRDGLTFDPNETWFSFGGLGI